MSCITRHRCRDVACYVSTSVAGNGECPFQFFLKRVLAINWMNGDNSYHPHSGRRARRRLQQRRG